jgi:hypothetical protein
MNFAVATEEKYEHSQPEQSVSAPKLRLCHINHKNFFPFTPEACMDMAFSVAF